MLLETIIQDLRIGLRVLIKEKGFCALAVGVLALGICGVTTQFSLVNAIALRGFNFPHADRIMGGGFIDPSQPNNFGAGLPFAQDYLDIIEAQQSFEKTAAFFSGSTVNVTHHGTPQRYTGGYVTEDFFRIIGVEPILGRNFTAADNAPGAERVTLISHEIWTRDFNADPKVVGASVRINGKPAIVIGVMPPRFKFPINEQLWVPIWDEFPVRTRDDPRGALGVAFMGRLKPGVTVDQANAEFDAFAKRIAAAHPKTSGRFTAALIQPMSTNLVGGVARQVVFIMLGAVIVVLLIACLNVANMQFARAALRTKELAVRGALGATRCRLIRQMLTESLILATMGSVLGVVLAYWAVDLIAHSTTSFQFPLPYWVTFDLDRTVLGVTLGTTLLAALFSGFMPALLTSRANAADVMKDAGRGNSGRLVNRLTAYLVVAQIMFTAMLLIASVLLVRSVVNRITVDYGYNETAILSARLGLFDADYPTPEARQKFYDQLLRQLRAAPEIESAALTNRFQMTFVFAGGPPRFEIDGQAYVAEEDRPFTNVEAISDGYFATLGLRLLEGREFLADDSDAKQPVAIVNASFAQKHFGRASPLGRRVRIHNRAQPQAWRTIVGVVPDTLMQGPLPNQNIKDSAGFYQLLATPLAPQFSTILVRPRPGQRADTLGAPLRRELAKVDPNLPLYFVDTPKAWHDGALGQVRILATLFTIFGVVAVILASVGLYGVMSFSVNQRTQEIGIRMALGADARRILTLVARLGALQLIVGLTTGMGLALLLVRLGGANVANFLFRVDPTDPTIYGGVCALLALVAAVSCLIPARRATRVDPMVALRAE